MTVVAFCEVNIVRILLITYAQRMLYMPHVFTCEHIVLVFCDVFEFEHLWRLRLVPALLDLIILFPEYILHILEIIRCLTSS